MKHSNELARVLFTFKRQKQYHRQKIRSSNEIGVEDNVKAIDSFTYLGIKSKTKETEKLESTEKNNIISDYSFYYSTNFSTLVGYGYKI